MPTILIKLLILYYCILNPRSSCNDNHFDTTVVLNSRHLTITKIADCLLLACRFRDGSEKCIEKLICWTIPNHPNRPPSNWQKRGQFLADSIARTAAAVAAEVAAPGQLLRPS